MAAWILPDHIADVLPSEARQIEDLRRTLLDTARTFGYELVIPPILEHLESLLSGAGGQLDLQTFKLVDQLSGRSLGLRADSTPQVARIDAHLLNRKGVTRLCYCGPVVHTLPERSLSSREPLQFGAELYGHQGPESDQEVLLLALQVLKASGIQRVVIDFNDVRIVRALIEAARLTPTQALQVRAAIAAKDTTALEPLLAHVPDEVRRGLMALPGLFGSREILVQAQAALPAWPEIVQALQNLRDLSEHIDGAEVSFDLGDLAGYAYYTGMRFSLYAGGQGQALVRGGRYDEVGAVFGRKRPAAGFSLDIKNLCQTVGLNDPKPAIRAPWSTQPELRRVVERLRGLGETVVCILPGHEHELDEFNCDRALVEVAGHWVIESIDRKDV
jgi:ATP phosphoribosyltransferase regulatory subunit